MKTTKTVDAMVKAADITVMAELLVKAAGEAVTGIVKAGRVVSVTFRSDEAAQAFGAAVRSTGRNPAVYGARFDDDAFVELTL